MSINIDITAPCESVSLLHGLGNKPLSTGANSFDMIRTKGPLCACGCGEPVKKNAKGSWNTYLMGHGRRDAVFSEEHRRNISLAARKRFPQQSPQLCSCGCGQLTNVYQGKARKFVLGHNRHGADFSKQHREKLRESRKYITVTEQSKEKISNTLKEYYKDKTKHPRWLNGKSMEEYSPDFNKELKVKVRVLYAHTCQLCGVKEKDTPRKLSVHHIDYNKKNNHLNNLIPLCTKCHTRTNSNRDYWQKLFSKKVIQ